MTDQTDTAPTPEGEDPDAPKRHTLPSGKVVEVRSHRTLTGTDATLALGMHTGGPSGAVAVRNRLIQIMVTEVAPGRGGTPVLDTTYAAVLNQRADDWRKLYDLVGEGFNLVTGQSVIPDQDEYKDPKAPTTGTSDSEPGSADEPQQ